MAHGVAADDLIMLEQLYCALMANANNQDGIILTDGEDLPCWCTFLSDATQKAHTEACWTARDTIVTLRRRYPEVVADTESKAEDLH